MTPKPVIFISATSDLRSARDLVGKVLYSMGYEPVWQDIEPTEGGELLEVLRERIAECTSVLQLVGSRYGAEPPQATAEFGRVSYTQFEALYAEKLGKKVIYHFLSPAFPADAAVPESEERAAMQAAYQQQIKAKNRLRHSDIEDSAHLELSIRRISNDLATLRKEAERRFRKLLWLSGAVVLGLVLVAGFMVLGFYVVHHRQEQQGEQANKLLSSTGDLSQQLDRIEKNLLAQKQANPKAAPELSPEDQKILDEARRHTDLKTKAVASVLQPDSRTDALLKQLNDKQEADRFELDMLNGKRWYFDKQSLYDKAAPFFEDAIALRPDAIEARQYAASSHVYARLGDRSGHYKRAIEICNGTLRLVEPKSPTWAKIQCILGNAWYLLPTGDRTENLRHAIEAYKAALSVQTKDTDPTDWAVTINDLGVAWCDMPVGDRSKQIGTVIETYQEVLDIYTKESQPRSWAMTQINLGNAWQLVATGNRDDHLRKAIEAYKAALTVFTKEAEPIAWATAQNNLGNALSNLRTGDRNENLREAIEAFEGSLTIRTKETDPAEWAMTQTNLGIAYSYLSVGDRSNNLRKAIELYEAALSVYTREGDPGSWAMVQTNLGNAWHALHVGNRSENIQKGIAAFEAALTVYTKDAYPVEWAGTENNLGNALFDLRSGDRNENLRKSIAAYQAALTVRTKETDPMDWAMTLNNLGDALSALQGGDRNDNLHKAIEMYQAALTVRTKEADPINWAVTQYNLGNAWVDLPTGDRDENLRRAIEAYQVSLTVRTKELDAEGWASTQYYLGRTWGGLSSGQPSENLRKAIEACEAALTVFTMDQYPNESVAIRTDLSWDQLVMKDFEGALRVSEVASTLHPPDLQLETNHAHALLLLGRTDEAKAIYFKYVGQRLGNRMWQEVVLSDFDELEKQGISSPAFAELRTQLGAHASATKPATETANQR